MPSEVQIFQTQTFCSKYQHIERTLKLSKFRQWKIRTNLVESAGAGQNDVRVFHLDNALSETDEVRTDADGSTRHQTHGDDVAVSTRRLARNHAGTTQTLHANPILLTCVSTTRQNTHSSSHLFHINN